MNETEKQYRHVVTEEWDRKGDTFFDRMPLIEIAFHFYSLGRLHNEPEFYAAPVAAADEECDKIARGFIGESWGSMSDEKKQAHRDFIRANLPASTPVEATDEQIEAEFQSFSDNKKKQTGKPISGIVRWVFAGGYRAALTKNNSELLALKRYRSFMLATYPQRDAHAIRELSETDRAALSQQERK